VPTFLPRQIALFCDTCRVICHHFLYLLVCYLHFANQYAIHNENMEKMKFLITVFFLLITISLGRKALEGQWKAGQFNDKY